MDRGPGSLASPHSNRRALRGCQRELVRKNRLPLDFQTSAPSSWAKIVHLAFRRYNSYLRRLLHLLRMLLAFFLPRSHHRRLLPKVRPSARRRRHSNNTPADPSPHDWAVGLLLRREILRHPLRRRSPPSLRPRRPLNRRRSQREKPVSNASSPAPPARLPRRLIPTTAGARLSASPSAPSTRASPSMRTRNLLLPPHHRRPFHPSPLPLRWHHPLHPGLRRSCTSSANLVAPSARKSSHRRPPWRIRPLRLRARST